MKLDLDMNRIAEIPDPLADAVDRPVRPRPESPSTCPRTRSRVSAARVTALCAALLYEGVWLVIFNKRGDLSGVPRTTLVAEVTIPLCAAGLALVAAAAPGGRGLGGSKGHLAAWVFMSPALFITATLFAGPADVDAESFWSHALRCFLVTGLLGLGPFALAVWAYRRAFVAVTAWRTAALGMACAAVATASMSLLCSVGSPAHVLLGHGGMMLIAGIAGALLGPRLCEA